MNQYPDYIVEKVMENLDCSREFVLQMKPFDVFNSVLCYEGIIGYSRYIRKWINDIYNMDLEKECGWNKTLEQGCDIYYVDEESTEIEHGMVSDVYLKGKDLSSFNVVFDNGDFEEIDASGLNKHYFIHKEDAENALSKWK